MCVLITDKSQSYSFAVSKNMLTPWLRWYLKTSDPLYFRPIKVADFYSLAATYAKLAKNTCWNRQQMKEFSLSLFTEAHLPRSYPTREAVPGLIGPSQRQAALRSQTCLVLISLR